VESSAKAGKPSKRRPAGDKPAGYPRPGVVEDLFVSDGAAFDFIESIRWSRGETCPHCAAVGRFGRLRNGETSSGVYKCYACRRLFTLKTGTGFEGSHLPYTTWLAATYLMVAWNGAISAACLSDLLGITVQTASKLRRTLVPCLEAPPLPPQVPGGPAGRLLSEPLEPIDLTGCGMGSSSRSPRQQRQVRLLAMIRAGQGSRVERAFREAVARLVFAGEPERPPRPRPRIVVMNDPAPPPR
jgi:transposase-like protein